MLNRKIYFSLKLLFFVQVVVWDSILWEKKKNRMLQKSVGRLPPSETYLQFHKDETHFLAVHDTHLAIYETTELRHVNQVSVSLSYASMRRYDKVNVFLLFLGNIIYKLMLIFCVLVVGCWRLLCTNIPCGILMWWPLGVCRLLWWDCVDIQCFKLAREMPD